MTSPPRNLILPKILPNAHHLLPITCDGRGHCFATTDSPLRSKLVRSLLLRTGTFTPCRVARDCVSAHAGRPGGGSTSRPASILVTGRLRPILSAVILLRPFNPLLESLPPVIKAGDPGAQRSQLDQPIYSICGDGGSGKHAGSDCVLTKLSELLFIDVVRRYLEALPPEHAGWLTGLVISYWQGDLHPYDEHQISSSLPGFTATSPFHLRKPLFSWTHR